MFVVHDVIDTKGACGRLKVVWTDRSQNAVVTVDDDDAKSWPELRDLDELRELVEENFWTVGAGQPPVYLDDSVYLAGVEPKNRDKRQAHLDARDADWRVLGPLMRDPRMFERGTRAELIARAAKDLDVTTTTIRTKLLRLFHGGMLPGALLPGYAKCGAPGEARPVEEGGKKSGPKPKEGRPSGHPVTKDLKRLFRIGFDWYENNPGQSLAAAYFHAMRFGFYEPVEKLIAKYGPKVPLAECAKLGMPRVEQFRYHWSCERNRIEAEQKRMGKRLFALRRRAIERDSTGETTGPGDCYQIDATQLNVYARSRRNRRKLVWRPTLYIVIDTWSRMIVGFALSLDPPSWVGAMTALANAMTDKVAFCEAHGVSITKDQWPSEHLPGSIVGDQAELARAGVLGLIERHGVTVANPPAYRPDWKGVVERRFGMIDLAMRPFTPGFLDVDFRERGAEDYRLATAMTLDDLTVQVIHTILYFNNYHPLKSYPRLPAMNEDQVPSVPCDLWRWGIANVSGIPRQGDEESVRFALLEKESAKVWRDGIHFHGCVYMCEKAKQERWREKARKNGRFDVHISFDRRTTDLIYVHDPDSPKGFQVAHLTTDDRTGASHWEIEDELRQERAIHTRQTAIATVGRIAHDGPMATVAEHAVSAMEETPPSPSKAAEVSHIRKNTAEERELDQVEQIADYHAPMLGDPDGSSASPSSALPPPERPMRHPANDDHARPSLRDRLKRRK